MRNLLVLLSHLRKAVPGRIVLGDPARALSRGPLSSLSTAWQPNVNWFTQSGGASVIDIAHARSCAPILFVGSAAHGGDHPDNRTGGCDLGAVSHRMIFQEGADHEIRSARYLS
jgi:hypothetical protein